jgi:hypothetical protein
MRLKKILAGATAAIEQENKNQNSNAKRRIVTDKSVWRDFNDR